MKYHKEERMDTSKEYIKMCEEAKEIHGLDSGPIIESFHAEVNNELVWLPRQDQLQETMEIHGVASLLSIFTYWFNEHVLHGDDSVSFNSMEQLWLAFVMKEKFNKVWKDGIWKKAN